ncbi:MAG: class I SAM-dependent methyltransferase [Candidatus Acidiferrales bacterium]
MARILLAVLSAGFVAWTFRQVRKPSGIFGKRVLNAMNVSHAALTDWGLRQITAPANATILDVGCGSGRTLQKLAALAREGRAFGVDYSPTSAAVSKRTNSREPRQVHVVQGSVAALPFPEGQFDLITAVEAHYYWPDLPANMRGVLRALKPGGTLVLIAETYRGGPLRFVYGAIMPLLRAAF